jgi:hypothetical protein
MAKDNDITDAIEQQTEVLNTSSNVNEAARDKSQKEAEKNSPLNLLTETLKTQNKVLESKLNIEELSSKLTLLNENSNENSQKLVSQFNDVRTILDNPSLSDEEKKSASETLEALGKLAQGEEQRRESEKKLKGQSKIWEKIKENTKGMADGLKSLGESLKSKGGLLAGLAGIALLLFSPETFVKIVSGAIDFVVDMFEVINKVFENDIGGALSLMWKHAGTLSGIILGIGLMFGGKIIGVFTKLKDAVTAVRTFMQMKWLPERIKDFTDFKKSLMTFVGKGWKRLKRAMKTAKVFMMTSFIPAMSGMFTSLGTALAPILAALAPMLVPALLIVGVALAIGLAIKSLYNAFNDAFKTFEETGSIMETFKAFTSGLYSTMIGYPLDLLKDLVSWVASALGFEKFSKLLDSFSFTDIFQNVVDTIIDTISGLMDSVVSFIEEVFDFDFLGTLTKAIPGLGFLLKKIGVGSTETKVTDKNEEAVKETPEVQTTKPQTQAELLAAQEEDALMAEQIEEELYGDPDAARKKRMRMAAEANLKETANAEIEKNIKSQKKGEEWRAFRKEARIPGRAGSERVADKKAKGKYKAYMAKQNEIIGQESQAERPDVDPEVARKKRMRMAAEANLKETFVRLETPDSEVYTKTNANLNEKAEADRESNNSVMSLGGDTSNSNATTNVSNSSTTISSGITPDDMVKKDFYNYGY